MAKITLTQQVADLTALVASLVAAQHSTPTAVAEAVVPAPVVVPEPVVTKADGARTLAASQGLAFARGGRCLLSIEALQAAVRVAKTGTPEVILQTGLGSLDKRNVVGLALFAAETGNGVTTQYLYAPEA